MSLRVLKLPVPSKVTAMGGRLHHDMGSTTLAMPSHAHVTMASRHFSLPPPALAARQRPAVLCRYTSVPGRLGQEGEEERPLSEVAKEAEERERSGSGGGSGASDQGLEELEQKSFHHETREDLLRRGAVVEEVVGRPPAHTPPDAEPHHAAGGTAEEGATGLGSATATAAGSSQRTGPRRGTYGAGGSHDQQGDVGGTTGGAGGVPPGTAGPGGWVKHEAKADSHHGEEGHPHTRRRYDDSE